MTNTENITPHNATAGTDTVFVADTADYLHAVPSTIQGNKWHPLLLDSVFADYKPKEVLHHNSIFTDHSLQPVHPNAIPRTCAEAPNWFLVLAAIVLALLSLFTHNTHIRARTLIPSAFNVRNMERFYRENNFNRSITMLPMLLFYAASLALCLFAIAHTPSYTMLSIHGILACLMLFVALTAYLILKTGFISLLGNVFNEKAYSLYISNNYVYQFLSSFILLPMAVVALFGNISADIAFKMIFISAAILFVMRLFRGMKLILTHSTNSKFYLFYYLCILEIVPLLVIGKHFFLL